MLRVKIVCPSQITSSNCPIHLRIMALEFSRQRQIISFNHPCVCRIERSNPSCLTVNEARPFILFNVLLIIELIQHYWEVKLDYCNGQGGTKTATETKLSFVVLIEGPITIYKSKGKYVCGELSKSKMFLLTLYIQEYRRT